MMESGQRHGLSATHEKKWLREPDHDEGDDPQPSTQYVQLNPTIKKQEARLKGH